MQKTAIITICVTALSMLLKGCSSMPSCCVISPPRIHLTGEKTVIERQIVGDYRELEEDAWVISSMKTTVASAEGLSSTSAADSETLRAMKIREYNSDKITDYKKQGAIGEANNGLLVYMHTDEIEDDPEEKRYLQRLINEENEARLTIFERTLLNINRRQPTGEEIEAFGRLFAEEKRAMAGKDEWIQDSSGRWIQK